MYIKKNNSLLIILYLLLFSIIIKVNIHCSSIEKEDPSFFKSLKKHGVTILGISAAFSIIPFCILFKTQFRDWTPTKNIGISLITGLSAGTISTLYFHFKKQQIGQDDIVLKDIDDLKDRKKLIEDCKKYLLEDGIDSLNNENPESKGEIHFIIYNENKKEVSYVYVEGDESENNPYKLNFFINPNHNYYNYLIEILKSTVISLNEYFFKEEFRLTEEERIDIFKFLMENNKHQNINPNQENEKKLEINKYQNENSNFLNKKQEISFKNNRSELSSSQNSSEFLLEEYKEEKSQNNSFVNFKDSEEDVDSLKKGELSEFMLEKCYNDFEILLGAETFKYQFNLNTTGEEYNQIKQALTFYIDDATDEDDNIDEEYIKNLFSFLEEHIDLSNSELLIYLKIMIYHSFNKNEIPANLIYCGEIKDLEYKKFVEEEEEIVIVFNEILDIDFWNIKDAINHQLSIINDNQDKIDFLNKIKAFKEKSFTDTKSFLEVINNYTKENKEEEKENNFVFKVSIDNAESFLEVINDYKKEEIPFYNNESKIESIISEKFEQKEEKEENGPFIYEREVEGKSFKFEFNKGTTIEEYNKLKKVLDCFMPESASFDTIKDMFIYLETLKEKSNDFLLNLLREMIYDTEQNPSMIIDTDIKYNGKIEETCTYKTKIEECEIIIIFNEILDKDYKKIINAIDKQLSLINDNKTKIDFLNKIKAFKEKSFTDTKSFLEVIDNYTKENKEEEKENNFVFKVSIDGEEIEISFNKISKNEYTQIEAEINKKLLVFNRNEEKKMFLNQIQKWKENNKDNVKLFIETIKEYNNNIEDI